jgi:transcriptional regulator with XRE-family HTH domain
MVYGYEEVPMPLRFGEVLRKLRRKDGNTLGDLAELLGVSTVYVSDVERGNRNPFSTDKILKIAEFLQTEPTELLRSADLERGVIEYDVRNGTELGAKVVGGLVTGLARGGISNRKLREIQTILEEEEK